MLINFSPKIVPYRLWDNAEKYVRTGQATDDNQTLALCVLDN
jgi:hypothetical protein